MKTIGIGTLVHDPQMQQLQFDEKQAKKCSFLLRCKEPDGQTQILKFELWDTAAEVLVAHAKQGDSIYVEAIPRSYESKKDAGIYKTIFRITNFSLINAS